ncbi:tryptophan synthase subunit alpha [Pelistega indica]|uniref:Tryptophan synthase alpha chain n=1 Tax=Pelistega indica TaxID=1414851 RepID=V8G5N3_9BURK|nr:MULTISPECIES: tryptophan synthase subunit alpha [Pelistega]ETD70962.1 tryptophan synthase subunit alpha [Pelistega indica]
MSNKRIDGVFKSLSGRAALIPYICAGDPNAKTSLAVMHALVANGADIIELGMPFSDPMADGPVIQYASERAIAAGMTLKKVLAIVADFRKVNTTTPVVLMGYANPVEAMGRAEFAQACEKVGVDGVLIVDYPPEEYDDFGDLLKSKGIDPIFLLAPTSTDERIQQVAKIASGYLYYVSLRGVTGSSALNVAEVEQRVQTIKKFVDIPVGVGFGISDAETAKRIASVADAVVIGSKLVDTMHKSLNGQIPEGVSSVVEQAAGDWIATIAEALQK